MHVGLWGHPAPPLAALEDRADEARHFRVAAATLGKMASSERSTRAHPTDPSQTAGPVLSEMIREQLAEERHRKDSLEQRGMAVITSSGILVALLLGIAGIATKDLLVTLPDLAKWSAGSALFLFAGAAIFGLWTNWAYKIDEPDVEQARELVNTRWDDEASNAERFVAKSYLTSIMSYRTKGKKKADRLLVALILEAVAIVALATSVAAILFPDLSRAIAH